MYIYIYSLKINHCCWSYPQCSCLVIPVRRFNVKTGRRLNIESVENRSAKLWRVAESKNADIEYQSIDLQD